MCLPQELGLDFEQLLVQGISLPPALRLHIEFGQVVGNPPHSRVVEAQGLERRLKDAPVPKRRRLHDCKDDIMDSYITPSNCKVFLAYVD
ncbi:hypothetical protein IWW34DRAFT_806267 [Fusarium oxysporum f. sp. albedinis]|nr:hypothetical protein IWW34DRAFT_806267 [Fusarium oxysporum f. sp. albedinis]